MSHRLLVAIALLAAIVAPVDGAAAPTYRFVVGEELTYRLVAEEDLLASPADNAAPPGRELRVAVLPVRRNADGSWRLLIRTTVRLFDTQRGVVDAEPVVRFENETLGWCHLTPDGGYQSNATLRDSLFYGAVPEWTLPPLPTDRSPDGRRAAASGQSYSLQLVNPGRLVGPITTPIDARYNNRRTLTMDFDGGRPTRLVTESSGGDADDRFHNRREVALVGTRRLTKQRVAAFDAAADRYFDVLSGWWSAIEAAHVSADPDACQSWLDAVAERIEDARTVEARPEFQSLYGALLATHRRETAFALDAAKERARLLQGPPLDWATTNLAGEPRRRADYVGRVVLLDFWYRGCPACVEALPMVKRLRERYADDPVSVVGVNNDRDPANARHVIDAFGIDYETLRNELTQPLVPAEDDPPQDDDRPLLSAAYGVTAWPTFVILDQRGRVAGIDNDFLANAEQRLATVIDRLLDSE